MDLWLTTAEQAAVDPPQATFALDRLADLADHLDVATTRRERVTLTRALFSLFLDCQDLGLCKAARAILARHETTHVLVGQVPAPSVQS